MPADARTMVAGGHLEEDSAEQRGWMTNWPLHLLVLVTAVLVPVLSSQPWTPLVMGLWVAAYAAAHWAVVLRRLPGAGPMSVAVLIALSLLALVVTDQGLHLFASFMLMWVLLPSYRSGAIATLVLGTGLVLVLLPETLSTGPTGPALAVAIATGAGSTAFSLVIASWIWRSEVISAQRHALAEELADTVTTLERTRAELGALERRRGAHEESVRLSAEIHDTLAQGFNSVLLLSRAARTAIDQGRTGDATDQLNVITATAHDNLVQTRALVAQGTEGTEGVRGTAAVTAAPLAASLRRLTGDAARRARALGASTTVDLDAGEAEATALPAPVAEALLRVAQEAVTNAVDHAGASRIRVTLGVWDTEATLDVFDDGCGFDPASVQRTELGGYGIAGMRDRVAALGGEFTVDSTVSGTAAGTVVAVRVPTGVVQP